MPIYEYRCQDCNYEFERMQKFSDPPLEDCPSCNGEVHKLISRSTFHLKGDGWYVTDYARKSGANGSNHATDSDGAGKSNDAGKSDSSSPSETSSESKASSTSTSQTDTSASTSKTSSSSSTSSTTASTSDT
jgi:putative FmdB family regulatory protein